MLINVKNNSDCIFLRNFGALKNACRMDKELSRTIVHNLLNIKAIKLNFTEPFVWASGWKSPIYCDNRLSLSYPHVRTLVRDAYVQVIREKFPDVELIAGVATGAIAQGALVADKLNLPLVYVREKAKEHGMKKLIEGFFEPGQKTVVIEDHISTGGSSLRALHELKNVGANVLGMVAVFSYEFPVAKEKFQENDCKLYTLSDFSTIVDVAYRDGYITEYEKDELRRWHENPQEYVFLKKK